MTKLVTLSGANQVIQPAILKANPNQFGDLEAGLLFFKAVADLYPGITWNELWSLPNTKKLAGWWTDLKKATSDVYDGVKQIVGDVKDGLGDTGGSTIRLLADEKVQNTITRAGAAYASGGTSEMAGFLSQIGQGTQNLFSKAGEAYKGTGLPPWTMYAGGGLLLVGLLYLLVKD